MPDPQRPLAPHTLSVPAARTLSNPTLTVPQMLAETPRWLLHLLPWLNIQGGVYQVNRRRIVLRQSDRIATTLVDDFAQRFARRHLDDRAVAPALLRFSP